MYVNIEPDCLGVDGAFHCLFGLDVTNVSYIEFGEKPLKERKAVFLLPHNFGEKKTILYRQVLPFGKGRVPV